MPLEKLPALGGSTFWVFGLDARLPPLILSSLTTRGSPGRTFVTRTSFSPTQQRSRQSTSQHLCRWHSPGRLRALHWERRNWQRTAEADRVAGEREMSLSTVADPGQIASKPEVTGLGRISPLLTKEDFLATSPSDARHFHREGMQIKQRTFSLD